MSDVLYVTGRKASQRLSDIVGGENVYTCDVPVAAFINLASLADELAKAAVNASLIVVPGSVKGDVSVISDKTGVKCVKGPRNIGNLKLFMEYVDKKSFSPIHPAEEALLEDIQLENESVLLEGRNPADPTLVIGSKKKVLLGGISHVIAEIADAPRLSRKELFERAHYYLDSGASIIDVGLIAGEDNSDSIPGMIGALKEVVDEPISVDSMKESEILAAVDSGVDLVLSLDEASIGLSHSIDVPAVILPRKKDGLIPKKVSERVSLLEGLISKADCPAIADPLLNPLGLGFTWSIADYLKFRGKNPDTPVLFGAGNVTELADADSPGMNMVLAGLASELDADLLFTTEASVKTSGCVAELARACEMMYVAKVRGQAPKDLGFNLLRLKDKRLQTTYFDESLAEAEKVKVKTVSPGKLDDSYFKIFITKDSINAVFIENDNLKTQFTGTSAINICNEITFRGLASGSHAAYLGRELAKAEIAFKLGKNYVQDADLF